VIVFIGFIHPEFMRSLCGIIVNYVLASQVNKNSSPPTKSCVLALCSCSCGDQVILLATVDCSVFSLLLLLLGSVYHNIKYMPIGSGIIPPMGNEQT